MSQADVALGLNLDLLGVVPADPSVPQDCRCGILYNEPLGRAAEAYQRIAKRLSGETIPIPDFSSKRKGLARLRDWISQTDLTNKGAGGAR